MKDKTSLSVIDADPIDFVHGLVVGGIENASLIATSTLKGARDGNLKSTFIKAIASVAQAGKSHADSMSYNEKISAYDDFNSIIEDIENGVDINKLQAKISLYLYSLTEDQKQRITSARLMRTLNDLSLDAILVLKALSNPELDKFREAHDQPAYFHAIALESGLGHTVYVVRAMEELTKEELVNFNYMNSGSSPLTVVGGDLLLRIDKYPDLDKF